MSSKEARGQNAHESLVTIPAEPGYSVDPDEKKG